MINKMPHYYRCDDNGLSNYKCHKYSSFLGADHASPPFSFIIPISPLIPQVFHSTILKYKLFKLSKITIAK